MQPQFDENQYKNINFFNNQISKPWTSKHGNEMVSISLPTHAKQNLGINLDTRVSFNVSKARIFVSKFNSKMSYTRIALDRKMNIYISHKEENGSYSNIAKEITGKELYEALINREKNYESNTMNPTTQNKQPRYKTQPVQDFQYNTTPNIYPKSAENDYETLFSHFGEENEIPSDSLQDSYNPQYSKNDNFTISQNDKNQSTSGPKTLFELELDEIQF